MELTTVLLIIFSLFVAAGVVIAWLAVCQRKGGMKYSRQKPMKYNRKIGEIRSPTLTVENKFASKQEGAPIAQETALTEGKTQLAVAQEVERIVQEIQPTVIPETKVATPENVESTAVQGFEPIEGKETQPQVLEEAHPIATETKQTVLKETPTATPEEPQTTSVEKVQPQVEKKLQPTGPRQGAPRATQRRRKPIHRGGRPRGSTQPRKPSQATVSRRQKPEIVCWKREQQWFIGVEVPEQLLGEGGGDLKVYQNGALLSRDDIREGCWLLNSISGQVTAQRRGEPVKGFNLSFGQYGYLLFKLSGESLNQGRLVKSSSSGLYLVIVPDSWERDETVSEAPPVMPEPTAIDGYSAHFFNLEKSRGTRIAFRRPGGDSIIVPSGSIRFELVGIQVEDTTEGVGPLFSGPPKIRALDTQAWKDVKTIVIGEEGPGRGKWRTAFSPHTDSDEQELPSEVQKRRGGWYFIRFYDDNDDLIESLDFRFLSGLKQIQVSGLSPIPSTDGHERVFVRIFHEPGITVQPVKTCSSLSIERGENHTTLVISPNYSCDVTHWLVGYGNGPRVKLAIVVDRVWWSLGEETVEPTQWNDKPITLSPDDFTAASTKSIWFRFPRARWASSISVGFERDKARKYPIKVTEKMLAVPLREFVDAKEVAEQTQDQRLKVWVERDSDMIEGVVAVISAIPMTPPLQEWVGIGRYKTAMARAVLRHGSGNIIVNGAPVDHYFQKAPDRAKRFLNRLRDLPMINDVLCQLDSYVEVKGSGPDTMRQAKAVAHALARALMKYDPKLKTLLKNHGFGRR